MTYLIQAQTTTGAGQGLSNRGAARTFQAVVYGSGEVTATVDIEVSNNKEDWLTLATLPLSGTTRATDGFAADAPWAFVRANVTAISGTGAAVDAILGA